MKIENSSVLTLRDLEAWTRPGVSLTVLGHPIKHSVSPPMHNAALAEMTRADPRFADWKYFRFEIPPDDLPRALELLHAKKFRGINLTVPHKVLAFDLVTEIDPAARTIGAVNTLRWTEQGWHGFNTDGYGLATAVRETLGCELGGTDVVLLGAGGAARGAAVECLQHKCASLWIANRTPENLEALLGVLQPVARNIPLHGFSPSLPPSHLPAGALVINATSAGLRPGDPSPIDLARLPRPAAVYDMIYNPPVTPLLAAASALGIPQANGLSMLVHQGARSLEIWSGVPAARTAPTMLAAVRAALGGR
ncbi:MAG TPA: shikimate dehydrogenase [Opitutaceae bacterium]|nr:shikimate dehydrogenase [Opitutaceae bacterium]